MPPNPLVALKIFRYCLVSALWCPPTRRLPSSRINTRHSPALFFFIFLSSKPKEVTSHFQPYSPLAIITTHEHMHSPVLNIIGFSLPSISKPTAFSARVALAAVSNPSPNPVAAILPVVPVSLPAVPVSLPVVAVSLPKAWLVRLPMPLLPLPRITEEITATAVFPPPITIAFLPLLGGSLNSRFRYARCFSRSRSTGERGSGEIGEWGGVRGKKKE